MVAGVGFIKCYVKNKIKKRKFLNKKVYLLYIHRNKLRYPIRFSGLLTINFYIYRANSLKIIMNIRQTQAVKG